MGLFFYQSVCAVREVSFQCNACAKLKGCVKLFLVESRFLYCFFLPVKVGVVEILVLTSICLRLGGFLYVHRVVPLNKCLAELKRDFASSTDRLIEVQTLIGKLKTDTHSLDQDLDHPTPYMYFHSPSPSSHTPLTAWLTSGNSGLSYFTQQRSFANFG